MRLLELIATSFHQHRGKTNYRSHVRATRIECLEPRLALNAAPVSNDDVYSIPVDTTLDRSAPGLLANDTDEDGDALSVDSVIAEVNGTLNWDPDGSFGYSPPSEFVGIETFSYQATDGTALSDSTTAKIRVGSYADVVLADSPLGYWRLGEPGIGAPAVDYSGNNLHGEYRGGTLRIPGAIAAENDTAVETPFVYLAQPPRLLELQNDFTIEGWVSLKTLNQVGRVFVNSQNYNSGIGFGISQGRLMFTTFGIKDYFSPATLNELDHWYHVAVVFDSSNDATFYVNGQAVSTEAGDRPPDLRGNNSALIGRRTGSDEELQGLIDEVAVYDYPLTSDQMLAHYRMGATHAGTAPIAVDDSYTAQVGEALTVDVARLPTPRHSFSDDFSSPSFNANLQDSFGAFFVDNGTLNPVEERRYVKTVKPDYVDGDFVFEIDVSMSDRNPAIEFIGLGTGERGQSYSEPGESLYVRFHSLDYDGEIGLSAFGPFGGFVIGDVRELGTHRVRLTKNGNTFTVEVDGNFNGTFVPDVSHVIEDLAEFAPYLNSTNSYLFVGGSTRASFDNWSVQSSLDESGVPGITDNDIDADNAQLNVTLVDEPQHGVLDLQNDGTFVYTSEIDYAGDDAFTYRTDDGRNLSNVATVRIHVNGPPVSVADEYTTFQDDILVVYASPNGLLQNDSDPNGDSLTVELVNDVQNGQLTLGLRGDFEYAPEPGFSGVDAFTYFARDGSSASKVTTVTIVVRPPNVPPTARDDVYALADDFTLNVPFDQGVLANDSDAEDDPLTAALVDGPSHGTLVLNDNGSFQYVAGESFSLWDSFTYLAVDSVDPSDVATVVIRGNVPIIEVGTHALRPNTSGQEIQIGVSGGQLVAGLNLFVQVGDGGPELSDFGIPAGTDGPAITAVDVKTDTIFATVPDPQVDQPGIPQVATSTIAISEEGQAVPADGLLATITIDTTGLFEGSWDLLLADVLPFASLSGPFTTDFAGVAAFVSNGQLVIRETGIVGRHLFYSGSAFGDTIAFDKRALMPGETASFANYSNYSQGINGLYIDAVNLLVEPTLNDFEFRVGRGGDLSTWTPGAEPTTFSFLKDEGVGGSDRIRMEWDDGAISGQWLEVTMLPSNTIGLIEPDVFYFGNAPGDTGDSTSHALVNATDIIRTRDNKQGPFNPPGIDDPFDFNRDGLVNATDVIFARDNITSPFTALQLITPGAEPEAAPRAVRTPRAPLVARRSSAKLVVLPRPAVDPTEPKSRAIDQGDAASVDLLVNRRRSDWSSMRARRQEGLPADDVERLDSWFAHLTDFAELRRK